MRSRSCLPRSPAWWCSSWRTMSRRSREILARHGLGEAALYLGAAVSELRVQIRVGDAQLDEAWADLRRAWSETSWRMRRLRDDPQCADEEYAAQAAEADPGLSVALELRSAGGHRRALRRARRAPGGGDPARAGRQQPDRDRGGLRRLRLRRARRAHDGPARRAAQPRRVQGARRLRRLLLRRRARSGRRLGEVDPVPRGGARGVRGASSRAATPSRSASATAARCSPPCRASFRAAAHWPRFVRTAASSTRRASRWWRCCPHPRCCSRTWRARCCRSRCRTARGARNLQTRPRPQRLRRERPGGPALHQR